MYGHVSFTEHLFVGYPAAKITLLAQLKYGLRYEDEFYS
jgi:hypothetical protein